MFKRLATGWREFRIQLFALRLARMVHQMGRYRPGRMKLGGFTVGYTDLHSCGFEYKDIFLRRIYHFETDKSNPVILDGGGCIGISVLYFKRTYPGARITCFEPDLDLVRVLRQNLVTNSISDVKIIPAGLAPHQGTAFFQPDGADGGKVIDALRASSTIQVVRLSDYLDVAVDFVKLNIEGQEFPVLQEVEASGKLHNIRQLVLEYHSWPGSKQRLGAILELLDRNGFRYIVHDFDAKSCSASKPPFRMTPKTTWYCLVYAKRLSNEDNLL
jgi:FkbM family methyltransferase